MTRYRSIALTVAWRHLHNWVRRPELLVPPLIFPLFFFAAFAGGLSAIDNAPAFDYPDYNAWQFVFVFLQTAAFGGVFTGFSIAADFESGLSRRLMLAAPRRTAIVAGYAIAGLVRFLVTGTIVFAVALIAGTDVAGGGVELSGLLGLGLILNFAAVLFAAGIAFRLRTFQAAPLMQIPVFLALMTAPVYVPRDLLVGWIETVAKYNPFTALLEAGRGMIVGLPADEGLAFAVVGGLAVAFAAWALRGLRKAEAAG